MDTPKRGKRGAGNGGGATGGKPNAEGKAPKVKRASKEAEREAAGPGVRGSTSNTGSDSILNEDQRRVLLLSHRNRWESAVAAKKKADAEVKQVGKLIKSDCGEFGLRQLKIIIGLENDGDGKEAARLQAQMMAETEAARWGGLPIGTQASFFPEEKRTKVQIRGDMAEDEGFKAGSDPTTPRKPPEKYGLTTPESQRWYAGFDRAQDELLKAFDKKGKPLLNKDGEPLGRPSADKAEATLGDAATDEAPMQAAGWSDQNSSATVN